MTLTGRDAGRFHTGKVPDDNRNSLDLIGYNDEVPTDATCCTEENTTKSQRAPISTCLKFIKISLKYPR